jgi:hypothetical protein
MSNAALETYLNDHLAGSVSAIQMLERAVEDHQATALGTRLGELLGAIREDQEELRGLIRRMGFSESPVKKAGAWLAEKAGRIKLGATTDADGLGRLEMLEALTMGLHGKMQLWRALRAAAPRHPPLQDLDLTRLERRAREQHDLADAWRIEAAETAL